MTLVAVTQGDPAGIGPEIILRAWRAAHEGRGLPAFYAVASPDLLVVTAARLNIDVSVEIVEPERAASVFPRALPVVPLEARFAPPVPGRPDPATAAGTIEAIERAVADIAAGRASAVVTNPIAKFVLYSAGFRHPGHTEFLGELAERHWGVRVRPVMMIWSRALAVVPITIHVPIARVPELLTAELVEDTVRIVARDWPRYGNGIPRIALAGLNPHAGEGGAIGREDEDILRPCVARLVAEGFDVRGPLSADTMFHERARATYDVALCPYHDQALIPVKTLAFDEGVNVTLGLPFVRTSPDHGTAFDIAGMGVARPVSLIEAIALAGRGDAQR